MPLAAIPSAEAHSLPRCWRPRPDAAQIAPVDDARADRHQDAGQRRVRKLASRCPGVTV